MALYSANYYIMQYLVGKGFELVNENYRYYDFIITDLLTESLDNMPYWYRILFAPPWG